MPTYRGRFAPSPTGPLHAGSLVAALASWLDARSHGGQWLLRIEDVDGARSVPGADVTILQQLGQCGLQPDEPVTWQSQHTARYKQAIDALKSSGLAYPCGCTRRDIAAALSLAGLHKARHADLPYPGTCRTGLHGTTARACRLRTDIQASNSAETLANIEQHAIRPIAYRGSTIAWFDRQLGPQVQDVEKEVGDFVLHRADGFFAYQLAVVVDDAAQGITHVVRGQDLADNTARQILLQRALGVSTPVYLHTPLVLGKSGEKLSKQNGAQAVETSTPLAALTALVQAARTLALSTPKTSDIPQALHGWTLEWRQRVGQTAHATA